MGGVRPGAEVVPWARRWSVGGGAVEHVQARIGNFHRSDGLGSI
jgi:hypothetical protein